MKTSPSSVLLPSDLPSSPPLLPPDIYARLAIIAAKERHLSIAACSARILGAFLLLALAGMAADRMFRFFHPVWRWLATLTVMAGTAALAWHWRKLISWKASPLAAAQAAEKAVPSLEERWSTLASLSARPVADSMRGADSLLARVRDEASVFTAAVPARTRAARPGFVRGLLWLAFGAAVTAVFYLSDPAAAGVRWRRLLAPWSNASLTQVNAFPQPVPVVVPRHEAWDLQAKVTGRAAPFADLLLKDVTGTESSVRLAAGDESGLFTHSLRDPQESFSFRFRAGDGETPWHQVKVSDRPVIALARVSVTPPAYTGLEVEEHAGIPPTVRALEGSRFMVALTTGGSGSEVSLLLRSGPKEIEQTVAMQRGDDGHYRWKGMLTESFRFQPVLKNSDGLTNKTPPVCFVEVIPDRPPVVTLAENSAVSALTPSDTIEVAFTASDDVGVRRTEIVVKLEKKGEPAQEIIVPVPMGKDQGARKVDKRVSLDLSTLPLEPGMKISYAVRATDGKGTRTDAGGKQNGAKPGEELAKQGEGDAKPGDENAKEGENAGKPGENSGKPSKGGGKPGDAQAKNDPKKGGKGEGADPGTMGTRKLDVGQCACSGCKNVEIEGYTGDSPAFREKVSIPVLPVLEKITAAVKAALTATTGAREGLPARTVLDEPRLKRVGEALTKTALASTECEALATKTKDTPYALIGLQLRDLRIDELAPATNSLTDSKKNPDPGAPLALAEVHLRQALDWLEKITKEATAVEKSEAVEALAQKIKQMHRIFLEDSMELLKKSKPGGPGAPSLGVIEQSEEYARLLKERMEKLNALMKEFAKLLESDPELMARYMDQQTKGAVALQGLLQALLTEQQGLNVQTASLAGCVSEVARINASEGIKAECQARYQALSSDIARTLRLAVTWYPKGLNKEEGPGADFLKALRFAAATLRSNPAEAMREIDRAVDALNVLGVMPEAGRYAYSRREEVINVKLTAMLLDAMMEAAGARKLGRVAELKQREVARRTREFAERITGGMMRISATWPEVEKFATAVKTSLFQGVLPHQRAAAGYLHVDHWTEAKASQREAVKGFIAAAAAWKNLIDAIGEEMKKNPPKPGDEIPDPNVPDLAALKELMDQEAADFDDYGLPKWSSNIQIISDWQKQCSSSSSSVGAKPNQSGTLPMPSPGGALQAAQERERELEKQAAKAQEAANAQARARAADPQQDDEARKKQGDQHGEGVANSKANSAAARRTDWNRLPSELNKDLRQQNDNPPPEEYRHAVEVYFRRIGVDNSQPAKVP